MGLVCAVGMLMASCSLDEDPRDQIPEEEAYGTADELFKNTVVTLYSYIGGSKNGQGLQGTCLGVYDLQTFGSDEAMLPTRGGDWYDGELWQDMYRHSWSAFLGPAKNAWDYLYQVISLCGHSLEQLEKHKSLLTDEQYLAYTSEVRALRAIYYWYLLDLFGRVPIIYSPDVPVSTISQSNRSELFEEIYNNLMSAVYYLSDGHSAQRNSSYGRVTKSVAYFVLAKLMLNAEVYTDDDWTDEVRPDGKDIMFDVNGDILNAWEATIAFCDYIESDNFRLADEYADNFVIRNENSPENIWVIPLDKDLYKTQQQNMIRFGRYESLFRGDEFDDKVDEGDGHTTVFPIPADVMSLNPLLEQNPGY